MAGIYIHIPFCSKACHYCDFHFSTNLSLKDEMVKAISKELEQRRSYLNDRVDTIYFGGGTPSLLSEEELQYLLETVHSNYNVNPEAEVTLEANPDDLSKFKLKQLFGAGINRLSIGIQSFVDEDLVFMNRSHNATQAIQSVKDARNIGFNNISTDLIFALPGRDTNWFRSNIENALKLEPEHISCYGLTVEPRTVLAAKVKKKEIIPAADKDFTSQYALLIDMLESEGYLHYEISNFARPGFESQHNRSYWQGKPYLGAGPGAHSFNGEFRRWNVRNNHQYVKALREDDVYYEAEELTPTDKINEYLLTSLRTSAGTDLQILERLAGGVFGEIMKEAHQHIEQGELVMSENKLFLTRKGKFLCDRITSDLFVTNVRTHYI